MDSLATLGLPAVGYGIRYDFGIFEQRIEDGRQVEMHDNWLQGGNPWELERGEDAQIVRLGGRTELRHDPDGRLRVDWIPATTILGIPYDSFIVGHKTNTVNTLRLWAARATRDFDLKFFNEGDYRRAVEEKIDSENISKVLYPNDQTEEGKSLRLKQQYFFVACSIGDMVRRYKQKHRSFDLFPKRVAIQLNDTHPSIGIAELMRILLDDESLDWDAAWSITEQTFGYTNHTLLPEALERWSVPLLEHLLPRHMQIIFEINQRFLRRVHTQWPGDSDRLARMSIIEESAPKQVRMAHLATVGSHSVNGVAQLHTDLVKKNLFNDFNELWPERINNKTNGVSPRRWVLYSNPRLTRLISSRLGTEWIDRDLRQLRQLTKFADDRPFLEALHGVKQANKRDLAVLVGRRVGVELPPEAMFVAQIKRIHEYKRQVMACLQAITFYLKLKRDPEGTADEVPRVYLFAGKAAAGYTMAKLHIKLINDVAEVINNDPVVQGRLALVFLPNYSVSLAQAIIPAADVSVQISTAGKEASGTSNMKFALNGALTLGTLDGANVEIREEVGHENFFLFGLNADEVVDLRASGYDPRAYIDRSPDARRGAGAHRVGVLQLWRAGQVQAYPRQPAHGRSLSGVRGLRRLRGDRGAGGGALPRSYRVVAARALQHRRGQPLLERRDHPPVRERDLGAAAGDGRPQAREGRGVTFSPRLIGRSVPFGCRRPWVGPTARRSGQADPRPGRRDSQRRQVGGRDGGASRQRSRGPRPPSAVTRDRRRRQSVRPRAP